MTDRRDPYRSMLVLGSLVWACAVFSVAGTVTLWIDASDSQRWAPATISTVLALVVLGSAIQLAILVRRYRRQRQHQTDANSDGGQ